MMRGLMMGLIVLGSAGSAAAQSTLYYCDCAAVEPAPHVACVAGTNSNPGTSATAPKQNLAGLNFEQLAGGSQLLFCRGGAWDWSTYIFDDNFNANRASPITFGAYEPPTGATGAPILHNTTVGAGAFAIGYYQNTSDDGGYVIRDLHLVGPGSQSTGAGIIMLGRTSDIILQDLRIEGYNIGIQLAGGAPHVLQHVQIINNTIERNPGMGILGAADDLLIEGNLIQENNFSGSGFNHGIYIGASNIGERVTIRKNRLLNNSLVDGICTGGNMTLHGQISQIVIEDNLIWVPDGSGTCYGISMTSGYTSVEYNHRAIIRRNTVVNVSYMYIIVQAATAPIIEDNRIISTTESPDYGITIENGDANDEVADAATVRNNTCYFANSGGNSTCVSVRRGTENIVSNNLVYFGASAGTGARCFGPADLANFTVFDHNHCHFAGTGSYAEDYGTLAAAQAAGIGTNDRTGDPLFAAVPSADNDWTLAVTESSPARNGGSNTYRAVRDFARCQRDTTPDIGAYEFGGSPCLNIWAPVDVR